MSDIMMVTPEMAAEWLKSNTKNRSLSQAIVNYYAAEMKAGRWELNGETIKFYENGTLKDGQHRLSAVVKAGVPVEMEVRFGVPNDSIICDRQRKRSVADMINIDNGGKLKTSNVEVGAYNLLVRISTHHNYGKIELSEKNAISFFEDYGNEFKRAYFIAGVTSSQILRKVSCCAAIWVWIMNGMDEEILKRFCEVARTGFYEDQAEMSAIVFRNYMIKNTRRYGYQQSVEDFYVMLAAIKDFANQKSRTLQYRINDVIGKNYLGTNADTIIRGYAM